MTYSNDERLCLNRWRGVPAKLLRSLNALDEHAISLGRCRFIEQRKTLIPDRLRCIQIRERLGLEPLDRLRTPEIAMQGTIQGTVREDEWKLAVIPVFEGWQVVMSKDVLLREGWDTVYEPTDDRATYKTKEEAQAALEGLK